MTSSHDTPSLARELYDEVRSLFVKKGTSLNAYCYCVEHRLSRQNARKAFLGEWKGPKAQAFKEHLIKAAHDDC